MANFWWNSTEDKRKIYWLNWEKLCFSKQDGGLGFKDIECFNRPSYLSILGDYYKTHYLYVLGCLEVDILTKRIFLLQFREEDHILLGEVSSMVVSC